MRVQIEVDSNLIQAAQIGTVYIVLAQGTKLKVQLGDDPDPANWKEVNASVLTRHLKKNERPKLVMPRPLQAKAAAKLASKLVQIEE